MSEVVNTDTLRDRWVRGYYLNPLTRAEAYALLDEIDRLRDDIQVLVDSIDGGKFWDGEEQERIMRSLRKLVDGNG